jgi:hypothetical protein
MRALTVFRSLLAASAAVAITACSDSTGPETQLQIAIPSNFVGTVTKVEYEGGNGPAGYYAQYDVWLVVPPGTTSNAGVVVPVHAPVFTRRGGAVYTADASDIHVGDQLEVWHDEFVGYGAVQAPPGAPAYTAMQVVIIR